MQDLLVDALLTKAAALGHIGRDFEATVLAEGALRIATDRGLVLQELRAMNNVVVQRIDQDPWRAYELGLESIERARRYGIRPTVIFAVLNTSEIALRLGEWEVAEAALEPAFSLDLDPSDRDIINLSMALVRLHRGEPDPSLAELRGRPTEGYGPLKYGLADAAMIEAQFTGDYATAYRVAMENAAVDNLNAPSMYQRATRAALWMGNLDLARESQAAFRAVGRTAALPAAQLIAGDAGVLAAEGRRAEALEGYRNAFQRYRDLRASFDGALVQLDAARLLGIGTPEGAAAAADARAVFERIGARPWLDVLAQFTAAAGPASVRAVDRSGAPTEASRA